MSDPAYLVDRDGTRRLADGSGGRNPLRVAVREALGAPPPGVLALPWTQIWTFLGRSGRVLWSWEVRGAYRVQVVEPASLNRRVTIMGRAGRAIEVNLARATWTERAAALWRFVRAAVRAVVLRR